MFPIYGRMGIDEIGMEKEKYCEENWEFFANEVVFSRAAGLSYGGPAFLLYG